MSIFGFSKTSIYLIILIIFFYSIYRFVLPYSDEPDFIWQSYDLVKYNNDRLSPYYYLNFLIQYLYTNTKLNILLDNVVNDNAYFYGLECIIDAPLLYLDAFISSSCVEELISAIIRLTILFVLLMPLFFLIIFKNFTYKIFSLAKINKNLTFEHIDERINVIGLTLLFPSIIYSIGVLSNEQLVLIVSLFIFLFYNSLLLIPILIYLIFLDLGNAIVILSFVFFSYLNLIIFKFFNLKVTIIINILVVFASIIFGYYVYNILYSLFNIFFDLNIKPFDFDSNYSQFNSNVYELDPGSKISIISDQYKENIDLGKFEHFPIFNELISKIINMEFELKTSGEADKYPLFFRPIITYLSFIYYPPSGLKTPFVFIFFTPIFLYSIYLLIKKQVIFNKNNSNIENQISINFLSSITCILIFVFIFPTYANAKYYLFVLPFLLLPILKIYKIKHILLVFVIMNILIISNILLYWL